MLVLGSGHAYGVMLNDDVTVADDFERTLEALDWMQFGEYARNSDYFEMALVGIRAACKSDLREKTT